ncbi:MAG: hypothetical protein F4X97_14785 [Boseongicola sp. SB0662_bin_57]|nr:hypothetical protein [Boseongicola sp. SB0662_bin_57]
MSKVEESIDFIKRLKSERLDAGKAEIQRAWVEWMNPERVRSVFVTDSFAMRFSEANAGAFSNTVLSLSALERHDAQPFVVAIVRPSRVDFMLANATFLKKISHSSQRLRVDNVTGSFNGSDILAEYEGIPNTPDSFGRLFARHESISWEENLERLVAATNDVVARNVRFKPTGAEIDAILAAPARFAAAMNAVEFAEAEHDLSACMEAAKPDILAAVQIDNVNIRGNAIERLIAGEGNTHELGDAVRPFGDGELVIDVKTKLLNRTSAPKAYNVDKVLRFLAKPESVLAFFIVGVDAKRGRVFGRLLTVLDDAVIESVRVQEHWAGRDSRGVTQLSGSSWHRVFAASFEPVIREDAARRFLQDLIER